MHASNARLQDVAFDMFTSASLSPPSFSFVYLLPLPPLSPSSTLFLSLLFLLHYLLSLPPLSPSLPSLSPFSFSFIYLLCLSPLSPSSTPSTNCIKHVSVLMVVHAPQLDVCVLPTLPVNFVKVSIQYMFNNMHVM